MINKNTIFKVATITLVVVILFMVIYIMANRLGLADDLDFGAGAYYYADIPEYDRLEQKIKFVSDLPIPVAILLFLAWGAIMYGVWVWIDKKSNGKD